MKFTTSKAQAVDVKERARQNWELFCWGENNKERGIKLEEACKREMDLYLMDWVRLVSICSIEFEIRGASLRGFPVATIYISY